MAPRAILLMGVSGAGKTTVGRLLAADLGWAFVDGDDLHPPANRKRMAAGIPLTDDDRRPWLEAVAAAIDASLAENHPAVFAVSALKRRYRAMLRRDGLSVVYLSVARPELERRLAGRSGHFFPPALLESQLRALEEPAAAADDPDAALRVDGGEPPERIVAAIRQALQI